MEQDTSGHIAEVELTLDQVVNGIEDELVVIDRDFRVRFANSVAQARLGKQPEALIGRPCYEVLHNRQAPCGSPFAPCPLREVVQSGANMTLLRSQPVGGATRYAKVSAYPLRDRHGNTTAMVEVTRDDTAARELETQIVRRHHQIAALHRISKAVSELQNLDTILRIALDSVLEMINGAIGGVLFVHQDTQTLSYDVYRGLSPAFARDMRMRLGEGIAGRVAQTGEPMLLDDISADPRAARPDLLRTEGLKAFVSIPLKAKNTVVGVMNVASHAVGQFGTDDMSLLSSIGEYLGTAIEQANLYEQLARANERYHALLQYSLNTQEEERKRIARELHDESSQALTSLSLSLQAALQMAVRSGVTDLQLLDRLKKAHAYAVHAGEEIVRVMKELRPSLLDELGLPAAIRRYAKDTLQDRGIDVSLTFRGSDQRRSPEVELALFRIAQGAIGNISKHSQAENASITLECGASGCLLAIQDDGVGFDAGELGERDSHVRGAGILTIQERARLLGGTCTVESEPGKGTRITVKIPAVADRAYEEDQTADR